MQSISSDPLPSDDMKQKAIKACARLNELPDLIRAANAQGDLKASQVLRTEKGHLEEYVPVLEAQAHLLPLQTHLAQVARCEQELLEAETTLRLATELNSAADRAFELQTQGLSQAPAVRVAKNSAAAQMYQARHRVADLRLELAKLRVRFQAEFR